MGKLESEFHEPITLLELRSRSIILVQKDSMIDHLYDLIGGRQTIWAAKGHPSLPSAITCCFFSSLKASLILIKAIGPLVRVNVPGLIVGRFSGDPHWPVLGDP
jgi:hypothetical protein